MSDEYQGDDDAPARIDTGYRAKPKAPHLGATCRTCREPAAILHHDPDRQDEPQRTVCGACAGKATRLIVDRMNPGRKEPRDANRG